MEKSFFLDLIFCVFHFFMVCVYVAERPFSVIIADSIPSGPGRFVLIVLMRPSLSASSMISPISWSGSPVSFWMVLGRAKLKPARSGLIPARKLRTRIISGRAWEGSPISLTHGMEGETLVKVRVFTLSLLRQRWRARDLSWSCKMREKKRGRVSLMLVFTSY